MKKNSIMTSPSQETLEMISKSSSALKRKYDDSCTTTLSQQVAVLDSKDFPTTPPINIGAKAASNDFDSCNVVHKEVRNFLYLSSEYIPKICRETGCSTLCIYIWIDSEDSSIQHYCCTVTKTIFIYFLSMYMFQYTKWMPFALIEIFE